MNREDLLAITEDMTDKDMPYSAILIRDHDTAQREALARVEADLKREKSEAWELCGIVDARTEERDTAQAQLAEAVGLLGTVAAHYVSIEKPEFAVRLNDFLARHAQAEQQEAQGPMAKMAEGLRQKAADEWASHPSNPANQEAQGAQAGDERAAFRKWFDDYSLAVRMNGGMMNDAQMYDAWQARAALAAQPAAIKLPERKRTDHLTAEYKTMTPTRASIESYNRALDDVAALNAVRGAEHE